MTIMTYFVIMIIITIIIIKINIIIFNKINAFIVVVVIV